MVLEAPERSENFFITPSEVIEQIRMVIPSFADRVAGAAQFDVIEDITEVDAPACFVMLANNSAETIANQTSLEQEVGHGIDILLILDAQDRRKQKAEELVCFFKGVFLYALNGWNPSENNAASPLEFTGDTWRATDRSRYMRVFSFRQDYRWLGSEDGMLPEETEALPIFDKFISKILNTDGAETPVEIVDLYEEGE